MSKIMSLKSEIRNPKMTVDNKKKYNLALVAGGYTGEYVISIKSAAVAEKHINADHFNTFKIIVEKDKWFHITAEGKEILVDKNDFSLKAARKKIKFDAVLLIIHGTPGEDGKLQGYFDMLGLPYTGCDAITSALTCNKRWTVATAAFSGIHVAKSVHLFKNSAYDKHNITALGFPIFVKPNNGGSSIGMSRVEKAADIEVALELAFKEDDQILVEQFIKGREFTIGVMHTRGETVVLPICEVRSKKAFFDYEAKYEGASEEIIPAPIDEHQAEVLRATAAKIYAVFNCKGIVRIDFIWHETENVPYLLEINTVPGQTEQSLVPQMVKNYGWTMTEFYTRQLENLV